MYVRIRAPERRKNYRKDEGFERGLIEAKKIVDEDDKLKRQFALLTIVKGVGTKTALTILADMPDVDKFKTAK
jgi:hypothetical protein